jgi:hypothetical protein
MHLFSLEQSRLAHDTFVAYRFTEFVNDFTPWGNFSWEKGNAQSLN